MARKGAQGRGPRAKIPINVKDDSGLSEEEEEEEDEEMPVLNLKGTDDEESDEESDEEMLTGLEAKLVQQAKLMKQKAGIEDEEDEEAEEQERAVWGRGKKTYYNADNVDFELQSSDEEEPAEEEAEATRLQQQMAASLRPEDYEIDEVESEMSDEEETLEEAAKKLNKKTTKKDHTSKKSGKPGMDSTIVMEQVKKDTHTLTKAEQMELLMSDAPELVGLTTELRDNLEELRNKVLPLLEKVKGGEGATEEGINYLGLKHMLLLSYCQAIVFYLVLKAEARSVRDHPVIGRLVELKQSLERIRPLDQKLQKQMDRLLKADHIAVSKNGETGRNENGSTPQSRTNAEGTQKKSSKKRKAQSQEFENGTNGRLGEASSLSIESRGMMQEKARLDARAQEREQVANVPTSKAEHKKVKRQKSSGSWARATADDLEDDVAANENLDNDVIKYLMGNTAKPKTLLQKIAGAGRPLKKAEISTGDADLPFRDDLGDRRRKHEIQMSNKAVDMQEDDNEEDDNTKPEPEEDEFYKQARLLKEAKKAAKLAKYSITPVLPEEDEEEGTEDKRHITYQMEKNRGLTPHRKKANKNPRKKYKLKHEKAVIRRKGQVRDVQVPKTSYGGETSGIRTNISRSVRFQY